MAVIFVSSSIPDLRQLPAGVSDHTGHVVGYAILGALVVRATSDATWRRLTARAAGAAWLLCAGYGVTDEFHQQFVHGRTPAFDDWVADATGAAVAIALVMIAGAVRSQRNRAV